MHTAATKYVSLHKQNLRTFLSPHFTAATTSKGLSIDVKLTAKYKQWIYDKSNALADALDAVVRFDKQVYMQKLRKQSANNKWLACIVDGHNNCDSRCFDGANIFAYLWGCACEVHAYIPTVLNQLCYLRSIFLPLTMLFISTPSKCTAFLLMKTSDTNI